ncbi:MAG: sigE 15 [Ilumatobacteraceae bacterium]|nr:sigE 15 [Ilumatobacteraceae bacterium]
MSRVPIDPLEPAAAEIGSIGNGSGWRSEDVGTRAVGLVETVEAAYLRLYPRLVRLAVLLVDTTEHAEEAVQDAFARAYPKWRFVKDPDAYMRVAVVNNCRRVQRRRSLLRRLVPQPQDDAALGADYVADVVRGLPLALRQVVVLRYYMQLSDAEIAQTLGIPPGTVKSTLHRARARLREELT